MAVLRAPYTVLSSNSHRSPFPLIVELAPGPQPRLWQERACVLRNLKRWEEALADVEQLLALETTAGDVRLRGELLLELGQKDAAEQELRRAVPTGW